MVQPLPQTLYHVATETELSIDFIAEVMLSTSLAPWVFGFPIPSSLRSAFLCSRNADYPVTGERDRVRERKRKRGRERERERKEET